MVNDKHPVKIFPNELLTTIVNVFEELLHEIPFTPMLNKDKTLSTFTTLSL